MTQPATSWLRTDWRRRRRTLLALTLLVGVAAGGVMAAAAGARRTATSLERLAAVSQTSDVLVDVSDGGLATARQIDGLPSVEHSASTTVVFAVVEGAEVDIGLFLPRDDALGVTIERDVLLRGRRADPTRADEVTIDELMASLVGLDVDDEFKIDTLTPEQVEAEQYEPALGPSLQVTVTGVTRGPGDLTAREEGNITATPALYDRVVGEVDEFATYTAVRLRSGATFDDFEAELATVAPLDTLSLAARTRPARETISTVAVGLAVLAAVAAAAALVTIGQAVARHVEGAVGDDATLRALGMVRQQRQWTLAGTVLPAALLAPAVAVAVAVLLSPVAPIGLARQAEPAPGIRIDSLVLVLGALATATVVLVAGATAASWATRIPRVRPLRRPSAVATAAARMGASPSAVNGLALALDRRPGGRPVRSTLVALAAAVIIAVAATTFAASLDRLAGESARWGSPWDLALDFTSSEVDGAAAELAGDAALASVGRWDSGAALVDGEFVRAFAVAPVRGEVGFTLVAGRQPHPGEVVVGPETADRSGVAIGDDVTVVSPDGRGSGNEALRIVGIALFPEVDDGDFEDAVGLTAEDFGAHASVPDLFEASQLVVRVEPGTSLPATEDRLRNRFGGALDNPHPIRPGAVGNLVGLRSIPQLLVVFALLLGLAALAHAVRAAAEREAGDFATLRALGMTRWQRWCCSLAQSVALAAVALVIGVPLGIAVGRATWTSVARSVEVATDPLVPFTLGLVVAGTAFAAVLAAAAAWGHLRSDPSAGPSGWERG